MLKATNTAQDVRSGFHHQMMMWYITTDAEKRSVQHLWFPITARDQRRGGRWVLKCKLGGDNYRNQEGYAEINGLMICSDWDIDCQQCRVVELEAELEKAKSDLKLLTDNMKVYRTTEELFADLDEVPNLKARLAKAQELRQFYAKRLSQPHISIASWRLSAPEFCILQVVLGEYEIDQYSIFRVDGVIVDDDKILQDAKDLGGESAVKGEP